MNNKTQHQKTAGEVLIYLLLVLFLFSVMTLPAINSLSVETKASTAAWNREQALQMAEAGINYYLWHLAHYPTDYKDGTNTAGPYQHTYTDLDTQTVVGYYSLTITPPTTGSTIVTIQSTGWTAQNPTIKRTVTARYGIPSLATYSFLSNSVIWIGNLETVNGKMHSNNGIRFDGIGNAPITSAKNTYTCSSSQGSPCPTTKAGVWGSATQQVKNFWDYPVPSVDFSALTANLSTMKSSAQTDGIYLPPSNAQGYSLVFNSAGTVSVYKVTSVLSNPSGQDVAGNTRTDQTDYNARTLQFTQNVPTNGVIYVEDKTWVEGTVHGRVIVAAAKLPYNASTAPSIYIPNNVLYTAKDGTDVLGLLAQRDVIVSYNAPTNLEIDAAMVAQNGSAQFFYWYGRIKNSISIYGSIMAYGQWTWTWVNGSNQVPSGYTNTSSTYDGNLLFGPPPSFPLSTDGYQQLSWTSD